MGEWLPDFDEKRYRKRNTIKWTINKYKYLADRLPAASQMVGRDTRQRILAALQIEADAIAPTAPRSEKGGEHHFISCRAHQYAAGACSASRCHDDDMPQSPQYVAQLRVENMWLELYSLTPGGFQEDEHTLRFSPAEESALSALKRLVSLFLVRYRDESMAVVTGNGDREYLFGPGQVGPFRFVFWE
ncbi:hypothetical protein [Streptomyces ochraceiscleroticus]|uniref:Uncharacterized protein n=1 Tax=Streptomyces ochraceiscleroticus TaxID=47761 RepID=A0ABW1MKM2_9ACTN|nr:hypothetical protein [Streptomyces ochraceiscleroticus]